MPMWLWRRFDKILPLSSDFVGYASLDENNLRKADKDYKADFFDQIRRNDGYKDQLEKLTARRCLDLSDATS